MGSPSPFLRGALEWIYQGAVPDRCDECGFDWSIEPDAALMLLDDSANRYGPLLRGRDAMVPAADGGWNAAAYLWHLTDLARSWSERWVQVIDSPGSTLVGWDPDELATVRGYRELPTVAAIWALQNSTQTFVELTNRTDPALAFQHGDWGAGVVGDGTRWLAHEYFHHLGDVDARASSI